jgi:hypothetical protein
MSMVGVVQRHLGLALLEQGRRCLYGSASTVTAGTAAAGTAAATSTATATAADAPPDYSKAIALFREALALEGAWHIGYYRHRQRPNVCSPEPSPAAGQQQRQQQQQQQQRQRQRPPEEAVYRVVSFPGTSTMVARCSCVLFKYVCGATPATRTSHHYILTGAV